MKLEQEKMQFIRQRCVIQNTDILKRNPISVRFEYKDTAEKQSFQIGFVDILVVLNSLDSDELNPEWGGNYRLLAQADNFQLEFKYPELIQKWNLLKDNLDDQTPECVELIYKLFN